MLNSPLTQLRKLQPGSITVEKVVRHFDRVGFPRTDASIGKFERGFVEKPLDRFFRAYAAALGIPVASVVGAHRRTTQWRVRRGREIGRKGGRKKTT